MEERLPQVVHCGPSLVSAYLELLPEQTTNAYWHQVLDVISSLPTSEALDWVDKFNDTSVPIYLQPSQDFGLFIKKTVLTALEDRTSNLEQVILLLERSGLCLRAHLR